ncbi:hypothetical protein [Aquimarina rhabdastrellae]
MKKILFLILCITSFSLVAQHPPKKGHRERVNAYKIAYLTDELNLTTKEAQGFWPLYNDHQKQLNAINKKERDLIHKYRKKNRGKETIENISENDATLFITHHLEIEKQKFESKNSFIIALKEVLPSKKIIHYIKAEKDFRRQLMKIFREKRKKQKH